LGVRSQEHRYEPLFNSALLAFKLGDFQNSFEKVTKALAIYPDHAESLELSKTLQDHFSTL
jgi:tetratricopeptide repeat protein 8